MYQSNRQIGMQVVGIQSKLINNKNFGRFYLINLQKDEGGKVDKFGLLQRRLSPAPQPGNPNSSPAGQTS
jgi:hypothetical protein